MWVGSSVVKVNSLGELSTSITRLQKRIRPRGEKMSVLKREIDDLLKDISSKRGKITEEITNRKLIEGKLRTTKALAKTVKSQPSQL